MRDFNFDKLKNINIPDSFVSGALEVPEVVAKPNNRFPKVLAFAATLIIVCSLSVTLFIFTQKENIKPPVNESSPTCATTPHVVETQETNNYVSSIEPTENKGSNIETENSEDETSNKTNNSETEDNTTGNSVTGSEVETTKPTKKPIPKPTEKPTTKPSQNPVETPTEKPTVKPTQKPIPPSEPEYIEPSEPPQPIEPSEYPEPTEPISPSESPSEDIDYYNYSVIAAFPESLVTSSGKIYCKVTDSSGKLLGNRDLYSNEHLTELYFLPHACAWYYPYRYNLITKSDYYTFCFYNSDGVSVYSTTIYLTN